MPSDRRGEGQIATKVAWWQNLLMRCYDIALKARCMEAFENITYFITIDFISTTELKYPNS